MENYLIIALVLIGLGIGLLIAEILVPTGGILIVVALLFFALGVGTLFYNSTSEGVVALVGLAVGLPAFGYAAIASWRRMSLSTPLDEPSVPPVAAVDGDVLKGRTGKTVSPMRPSGSVEFDGKRVDAMTEGMMLDAGVWVRCVEVKRGQVIVRKMEEPPDETDAATPATAAAVPPPAPKVAPPPSEEPKKDEPKKPPNPYGDDDDFDIGLDRT